MEPVSDLVFCLSRRKFLSVCLYQLKAVWLPWLGKYCFPLPWDEGYIQYYIDSLLLWNKE